MDANEVIELARKHLYIDRTDTLGSVTIGGKEALAEAIMQRLNPERRFRLYVVEQGHWFPIFHFPGSGYLEFATLEEAKKEAMQRVDDALPNNQVAVLEFCGYAAFGGDGEGYWMEAVDRSIQKPAALADPDSSKQARKLHRDRFVAHLDAWASATESPEYGGDLSDWIWDWFVENPVPIDGNAS